MKPVNEICSSCCLLSKCTFEKRPDEGAGTHQKPPQRPIPKSSSTGDHTFRSVGRWEDGWCRAATRGVSERGDPCKAEENIKT